jgi:hypothetical protein
MLGDEIEDHLPADRCDPQQTGQAELARHAITTVRLDGGVKAPEASFGGGCSCSLLSLKSIGRPLADANVILE